MQQEKMARKPEIVSLTSLRGVAAMGIVVLHLYPQLGGYWSFNDVSPVLSKGHLWVDFFFVLSGFIMCYVYREAFLGGVTWAKYSSFMWVRLVRIYPLHFVALMCFLGFEMAQYVLVQFNVVQGITVFSDHSSPFSFFANVLLIHAWGMLDMVGWNQPSWSISAELFAYLIFPFLVLMQTGKRWVVIGLFGVLAFVFLAFVQTKVGSLNSTMIYGVQRGLGGFFAGIAVFYLAFYEQHLKLWMVNFLQGIAFLGVFAVMHFSVMEIFIMPFFILLIFSASADRGWVGWFCRLRPAYFLGLISYSLYITHNVVTQALSQKWISIIPGASAIFESAWIWLYIGVELVLIMAIAYLAYRFIEMPARLALRRLYTPASRPA